MLAEIAILLLLTVLNGVLAMSELAVVSARSARLRVMADKGSRGAVVALALAETPGKFLSAVQIGITLVGVLNGAFSGATLGARLSVVLSGLGLSPAAADALGVGAVVVVITYLSLVIGELVPKQIALRDPEAVAARVAPAMAMIARLTSPLVWLLDRSGRALLYLLGQRGEGEDTVTEEEVRTVIAEAQSAGVLEAEERDMISGVMRLVDRNARALMTPRPDVEVLDLADSHDEVRAMLRATRRTRLPVRDGDEEAIVGIAMVKDLLDAFAADEAPDLRPLVIEAPVVLDTTGALDVLKAIRATRAHMALVFDEYGHFEGIVSSGDVLEAITGVLPDTLDDEPACVERADGSWLVAGWMPIDEFAERFGIVAGGDGAYVTVAGFMLEGFGRLPEIGAAFERQGWRFEVLDLDGRRIDKVLVSRVAA